MANAEIKLKKLLDDIVKEYKYENYNIDVKKTSTEASSFTSELFHIKVSANNRDELDLFAKVANLNRDLCESTTMSRFFANEIFFYTHIAKAFEELQNKNRVPNEQRFMLPKLYAHSSAHDDEVIILENVGAKGFVNYNRKEPVTWEYAAASIEQLAKFHALSFAYFKESPEGLDTVIQNFSEPQFSNQFMKDVFLAPTINISRESIREENRERFDKYYNSGDRIEEGANCYRPVTKTVLTRGDFRPSNVMLRYHEGKLQVVTMDFQTILAGCPVADLLYFIYNGTDGQFRKQYYQQLLEHYYTNLTEALKQLNVDVDTVYTRENYAEDLKAERMYGLFVALTVLPVVTAEAESAPKIGKESNLKKEEISVKPNSVYQQRLNEIVDEYVELGLL